MGIKAEIQRMMLPLRRKVYSIVSKAILLEYKHSGALPLLKIQLGEGEVRQNIEMIQPYGIASRPKAGAEVLPVFIGGMREHGVAVVVDVSGTRIKLDADGDVAIYRETGEKIYLSDKKISITCTGGTIEATGATVNVKGGEVNLSDGVPLQSLLNKTAMDFFNTHTHLVAALPSVGTPPPTIPTLTPTVPMVENVHTTIKTKGA